MTPEETSKKMLEQLLPLLNEGRTVEIHPQGSSMFPLLTEGRDSVLLCSLNDTAPEKQRTSGASQSLPRPAGRLLFCRGQPDRD